MVRILVILVYQKFNFLGDANGYLNVSDWSSVQLNDYGVFSKNRSPCENALS
jgi:hypothetical protein